jgi:multiple sugar transport system ATP-binding protein
MASVKLEGIRKVYEDGGRTHVAVHGVDLVVADGEFVVLVGPSGCGKSTTLRMIAGLEEITAGRLFIGDRDVTHLAPRDRDIAMVFQSYALYPHMTVYENMAFALRMRKRPKPEIDARVREAAGILGIEELLERRPRQLSGGQRQRVALGRAIVRQPAVFLFDEPLSNLDAKLRVQMRRELARLHRTLGATMIYVTHDQVEAMTLGDRIVVLDRGHVQQVDTPLGLYETPANTFVAGFIGSPAMNLLGGELTDGRPRFTADGGGLAVDLDEAWAALAQRGPRRVVLGVRPEHLRVAEAGEAAAHPVRLDLVEPLGSELLVSVSIPQHELTLRIAPRPLPAPGSRIAITADPARLHLFDPASGARLLPV